MTPWSLEGKKAIVTGGTKGIGLAVAQEFLSLGAELLVVARSVSNVEKTLGKENVVSLAGDLTDPNFRKKILQTASDKWGKVDILVNNVGTNIRKKFIEYTEAEYRKLFEINLFSMMDLTQGAFEMLKKSGQGKVINIASIAGSFDVQSGTPYGMTKAAVIQFTRHLAAEWAPYNIRVNAVSP